MRPKTQLDCLTVRHTPAYGHPSPRGDGLTHHIYCQCIIKKSLPRHPLSERGGRRPGCVASSNRQESGCVAPSNNQVLFSVASSNRQESGCVAPSNRQESGCVAQSNNQVLFCVALSNRRESGHSASAVEKGAVICLFFGCFYALTFCISVNNSVFALFCACLCRFCVCRRIPSSFCGLFSGPVVTFLKFFSCFKLLQISGCAALLCFRAKIFFGSLENGCIFALAFASGRGLLKKEAQGH